MKDKIYKVKPSFVDFRHYVSHQVDYQVWAEVYSWDTRIIEVAVKNHIKLEIKNEI